MKFFWIVCVFMCCIVSSVAGEIQFHYDSSKNPERVFGSGHYLITLEHASPTSFGDAFYFVDAKGEKNSRLKTDFLYFEIHAGLSLDKLFNIRPLGDLGDIQIHLEVDDSSADFINQRVLYGFDFKASSEFFNVLKLELLVSDEENRDSGHFQFTVVWLKEFQWMGQTFYFKGFGDYWETDDGLGKDYQILMIQPQLVWKLSKNLRLGTELELSNNFYGQGESYLNQSFFLAINF